MKMITLVLLGALLAITANGQTVYKCSIDGVTTFTGQPCGTDAQKIPVPDAPKADPHEVARRAAVRERMAAQSRVRDLDQQEQACVDNASWATRRSTAEQIKQAQAQIAEIQRQRVWYNPRSTAQATYAQTFANGQNARIAALQASIDRAEQRRTLAIANARTACASRRAQVEHTEP